MSATVRGADEEAVAEALEAWGQTSAAAKGAQPHHGDALQVLQGADPEALVSLLSRPSKELAERLVDALSDLEPRGGGWARGLAGTTVTLVARLDLELPTHPSYLRDAMGLASATFDHGSPLFRDLVMMSSDSNAAAPVDPELIAPRFEEHAVAAAAAGITGLGAFPSALAGALDRGAVGRDTALDIAVNGLAASVKPRERKAWVRFLETRAGLEPSELAVRVSPLVAALSVGDGLVNAALSPGLIAAAAGEDLPDVALAALSASTAAARKAALTALATRPLGADSLNDDERAGYWALAEPLTNERAPGIAAAAGRWVKAWGLQPAPAAEAGRVGQRGEAAVDPLWLPTPPLWNVAPYEPLPVDRDGLRAALAALPRDVGTEDWDLFPGDLEGERLVEVLNALAYADPEAARAELRRNRSVSDRYADALRAWVEGGATNAMPTRFSDALERRTLEVLASPGRVGVLLSTPTSVDLTVSATALVTRLRAYDEHGWSVGEADLVTALLRLDPATVSAAERTALREATAPLKEPDSEADPSPRPGAPGAQGAAPARPVGPLIDAYLEDPLLEPPIEQSPPPVMLGQLPPVVVPASLLAFDLVSSNDPSRIVGRGRLGLHPLWGDRACPRPVDGEDVVSDWVWRQQARRRAPLTPGMAMNLLGAFRRVGGAGQRLRDDAVQEAWERGLLVPGAASLQFLDWDGEPQRLGPLAKGLLRLAEADGLGAVAWDVLEQILALSLTEAKLPAGTAEAAEAMLVLAPSAVRAVHRGDAEASVLGVPALRALAARRGSARAVVAARDAVQACERRDPVAPSAPG